VVKGSNRQLFQLMRDQVVVCDGEPNTVCTVIERRVRQWTLKLLLCIDDRPQVLEIRKATLGSHGYCVKIASADYTALKMLEEAPVAAVLVEYKHEGMDAEAVACHIKQRFPNLPIILLSAYCEMPERILLVGG
jgi:response regulator RpfG family c-di-GMP phosphodiesterase